MPVGLSDGEQYKDEFEQVAQSIPEEPVKEPSTSVEEDKGIGLANISEGAALSSLFLVPGKDWTFDSRGNISTEKSQLRYGDSGRYHMINAETGKYAGYADLSYRQGQRSVYVSYISSDPTGDIPKGTSGSFAKDNSNLSQKALESNYNNQTLGMKETRSLLSELKRIWPEAERVYGLRVSGARAAAEEAGRGSARQSVLLPKERPLPPGRILSEAEWQASRAAGATRPVGIPARTALGVGGGSGLPPMNSGRWGTMPLE